MANIFRIRMAQSSYTARLKGVPGTSTDGEVIQGVYNATYDMHEFAITKTGRYELWFDPNGGTNYTKDSEWGGADGKLLLGDDAQTHLEGHGSGPGGKIAPADTTFAADLEVAP